MPLAMHPATPNTGTAMTKIAIIQSNYIPWKGYFDIIASVDEFVIYDDMQYTRRDWRNRNQIKTSNGVQWLTVPVKVKGKYFQKIHETEIDQDEWRTAHWKAICQNYKRAHHFEEIHALLEPIYTGKPFAYLSDLNRALIERVCGYLGIMTKISSSRDYTLAEERTDRLCSICIQAGASEYVTGPSARDYMDEGIFTAQGVSVTWFEYGDYPEHPQLWGEFTHHVSVIDLLFNCGPNASRFMKYCGK